jgi:FeS assembly SUF system protein
MNSKPKPVVLGMDRLPSKPGSDQEAAAASSPETSASSSGEGQTLEQCVLDVLRSCYDPEIPVNIYELGLVYNLDVTPEGAVQIRMTLTSPACPVAGSLPGEVEARIRALPGVTDVKVELVWDPPWDQSRMSEAAQLQLGLF